MIGAELLSGMKETDLVRPVLSLHPYISTVHASVASITQSVTYCRCQERLLRHHARVHSPYSI